MPSLADRHPYPWISEDILDIAALRSALDDQPEHCAVESLSSRGQPAVAGATASRLQQGERPWRDTSRIGGWLLISQEALQRSARHTHET